MRNFVLDLMKITEEFLFSIFSLIYLLSSYRIFICVYSYLLHIITIIIIMIIISSNSYNLSNNGNDNN